MDKSDVKSVYTAIVASDLGFNPTNEGDQIRILIPALTEDKRRELAKKGKAYAEDAKVAVRNIRRDAVDDVKKIEKEENLSEDEVKDGQNEVQKLTDKYTKIIDSVEQEKEQEVMQV